MLGTLEIAKMDGDLKQNVWQGLSSLEGSKEKGSYFV